MLLRRVKNLIELSKYKPDGVEQVLLKKDVVKKKRQKLATIINYNPMDEFPEEK